MSAVPQDLLAKTANLSAEATQPFAGSTKAYMTGSRADIRVPYRQIA